MAWRNVVEGTGAWVCEYGFYQPRYKYWYQANALALLLNDHDLAIVSPPTGLSEENFAEIDAHGQVVALIASCAGHVAGQAAWQARYPGAVPYAPTAALKKLESFGRPFVPLSQLSAPRVEFREVLGDTIAIAKHGERAVVYLGELALNGNSMPVGRLKFWLTGRVPGLRINSVYARSLGPAVQTAAREVLDALSGDPAIVLSHGAPLVGPGDAARVRKLVQPLDRSAAR